PLDTVAEHFLPNHYDPARFALKLAHKDVSLATQLGKDVGVPMRLANLTLEEMTEALGRGWQSRDSRSSMILQQERAGIKIAVDPEDLRAILRADTNTWSRLAAATPGLVSQRRPRGCRRVGDVQEEGAHHGRDKAEQGQSIEATRVGAGGVLHDADPPRADKASDVADRIDPGE